MYFFVYKRRSKDEKLMFRGNQSKLYTRDRKYEKESTGKKAE
jgi:hypothetical protein